MVIDVGYITDRCPDGKAHMGHRVQWPHVSLSRLYKPGGWQAGLNHCVWPQTNS